MKLSISRIFAGTFIVFGIFCTLFLNASQGSGFPAAAIYFSDYGTSSIWRVKPDGTEATQILTGLTNIRGLSVDLGAGKLYFVQQNPGYVRRANLDGSGLEIVTAIGPSPHDVELDLVRGKVYWTEFGTVGVRRANLDGTGVETLPLTNVTNAVGLALDVGGGKFYWCDYFAGTISRANLDGTGQQALVSGQSNPNHIALDPQSGYLYWTVSGSQQIRRSNLDGSGTVTLVSGQSTPSGLMLDLAGGKMYWANEAIGRVSRANLDGSNVEIFRTGLSNPFSFAVLASPPTPAIYFSDYGTSSIWRVKPDGTEAAQILTGLSNIRGLAVNLGAGKLYFAQLNTGYIRRANLDGSGAEIVVGTGTSPFDVELDLVRGKVYWTEYGTVGVRRANLDGTGIQTLPLSNVTNATSLALDVVGGKVYWPDYFAGTVSRANLDGTGQQTLVSGLPTPNHTALDLANGHLYWSETGSGQIRRSNLDGSSIVTLVSGQTTLSGLMLHLPAGKIYWANEAIGRIGRANLDGSNVEIFRTGLSNPLSFALLSGEPRNAAPTANAGPDQAIDAGQLVSLDGSQSFDDNTPTPSLIFAWSFVSVPPGSTATLAGANSASPFFTADKAGTYVVQLIVTDTDGRTSAPDTVAVSSLNAAPSANAGMNQAAIVGQTVGLDGSGSFDPDGDVLTYSWTLQVPAGSLTSLSGATTAYPTFVPDMAGTYIANLTVSDGLGGTATGGTSISVITAEDFVEYEAAASQNFVVTLPPGSVTTAGNQNAIQNLLRQVIESLQVDDVETARQKLEQAIQRTDGCMLRGSPDGNGPSRDWVTNCGDQAVLYDSLTAALNALNL